MGLPLILAIAVTVAFGQGSQTAEIDPPDVVRVTGEPTTCDVVWRLCFAPGGTPFSEATACTLHPVGCAPHTRFVADLPADVLTSGSCRFRLDPPGAGDSFTVKKLSVDYLVPRWAYVSRSSPEPFVPTDSDCSSMFVVLPHIVPW